MGKEVPTPVRESHRGGDGTHCRGKASIFRSPKIHEGTGALRRLGPRPCKHCKGRGPFGPPVRALQAVPVCSKRKVRRACYLSPLAPHPYDASTDTFTISCPQQSTKGWVGGMFRGGSSMLISQWQPSTGQR